MTSYPSAATSVLIARAEVIGKSLTRRGWTSSVEPRTKHPGTHHATLWVPGATPGVSLLILTIDGRQGQLAELFGPANSTARADVDGRPRSGRRPSWRLTAYDAPAAALIAAALSAADDPPDAQTLEAAGWTVVRHQADDRRRPALPEFIRPDGAVSAAFRAPTFTPPCERCSHCGELGDMGGWLITGPGFTADATAHTPGSVVTAFALALPGDGAGSARPVAATS